MTSSTSIMMSKSHHGVVTSSTFKKNKNKKGLKLPLKIAISIFFYKKSKVAIGKKTIKKNKAKWCLSCDFTNREREKKNKIATSSFDLSHFGNYF